MRTINMAYHSKRKNGKYALIMGGEIVKIKYWTDPKNKEKQEIYFVDKHGKTWWDYYDRFIKFDNSKLKLRLYNRKRLKNPYN